MLKQGSKSDPGPPDLLQLLKNFLHKLFKYNLVPNQPNNKTSAAKSIPWRWMGSGLAVVLALWALSGVFLVRPAEQSIILRWGQYVRTVGPGPHWLMPLVETKYTVDTQRISSFPYEAEMLTKDENIVNVQVQVQYRIANPLDFLFHVIDPTETVHQAVSSALRQIVGQMELDPLLTTGREELTQRFTDQLAKTLISYQTGIEIRDLALQSVAPPEAVTEAFDDVVKAREDRQRYANQAETYAKKAVLLATGEVARVTQQANAYQYTVVVRAQGETARYLALLKPYQQSPVVTRERLYLDTMAAVLAQSHNIFIDSPSGNSNVFYLPYLPTSLPGSSPANQQAAQPLALQSAQSASLAHSSDGAGNSTDFSMDRPTYLLGDDH